MPLPVRRTPNAREPDILSRTPYPAQSAFPGRSLLPASQMWLPPAACPRSEPRSNLGGSGDLGSGRSPPRHRRHSCACEQLIQRCVRIQGRARARQGAQTFCRTRAGRVIHRDHGSTPTRAKPVTNLCPRSPCMSRSGAAGGIASGTGTLLCRLFLLFLGLSLTRGHGWDGWEAAAEQSPNGTYPSEEANRLRSGGCRHCATL